MDIQSELQMLFAKHEPDLAAYAWASEADRWNELVFCLLARCAPDDPTAVRAAAAQLRELSLTDPGRMADLDKNESEGGIAAGFVLKHNGFTGPQVALARRVLASAAQAVNRTCEGKLQKLMRAQAERMRDELVLQLECKDLPKAEVSAAVAHWLQNAFSLPVSMEHPAVVEFCRRNGVRMEDLYRTADNMNINIAILDDLLEMDSIDRQADVQTAKQVP